MLSRVYSSSGAFVPLVARKYLFFLVPDQFGARDSGSGLPQSRPSAPAWRHNTRNMRWARLWDSQCAGHPRLKTFARSRWPLGAVGLPLRSKRLLLLSKLHPEVLFQENMLDAAKLCSTTLCCALLVHGYLWVHGHFYKDTDMFVPCLGLAALGNGF